MLNTLLIAPSATPSRAAKARTRAGLIWRLKELTIDRAKAPREPMVTAAKSGPRSAASVSELTSGVRIHVAIAATTTTPMVIAVFWTTESMVIGPDVVVGACPLLPGVPTDHWEGSVTGWP